MIVSAWVVPMMAGAAIGAGGLGAWLTFKRSFRRHRVDPADGERSLIDQMSGAFVVIDDHGVILDANRAGVELLVPKRGRGAAATDPATFVGKRLDKVLPPALLGAVREAVRTPNQAVPAQLAGETDAIRVLDVTAFQPVSVGPLEVGPRSSMMLSRRESSQESQERSSDHPDTDGIDDDRPNPDRPNPDRRSTMTRRTKTRQFIRFDDVTDRVFQDAALTNAEHRFDRAFRSAPYGMGIVRLEDGRLVEANDALAALLAMPAELLIGCTLREFTHPDDVEIVQSHKAQLELGAITEFRLEHRLRRRDGDHFWARTSMSLYDETGQRMAIAHIQDVTEQMLIAERLRYASRHDTLTGLPNRIYLSHLLADRLVEAGPGTLSVLVLDIDRFKTINDSLGHEFGDALVRQVGERIRSGLHENAILARFSGDEFVVVSDRNGAELAEHLQAVILDPFVIGDQELVLTISIGYSTNEAPDITADDLLRDADAALARAKRRGRNRVERYEAGGHEVSHQALRTTGEIRRGLRRGEFVPYFQPFVDIQTGQVVGYEALARWLHPDRGLLQPDQFMHLVEESGLVSELGAIILRDSLAECARWPVPIDRPDPLTLSVNVATQQLLDPNFAPLVAATLAETGVDSNRLWLEITEHSLLTDEQQSATAVTELRSLGLHLAVDDFGTGYSSLAYLKRFPVEMIKVDKSFVAGIGLDSDDSSIVAAVVGLGRSLGLWVVAEGLESPLQLSQLREMGAHVGQGYLFGRPRPSNLIEFNVNTDGSVF